MFNMLEVDNDQDLSMTNYTHSGGFFILTWWDDQEPQDEGCCYWVNTDEAGEIIEHGSHRAF